MALNLLANSELHEQSGERISYRGIWLTSGALDGATALIESGDLNLNPHGNHTYTHLRLEQVYLCSFHENGTFGANQGVLWGIYNDPVGVSVYYYAVVRSGLTYSVDFRNFPYGGLIPIHANPEFALRLRYRSYTGINGQLGEGCQVIINARLIG